MRKIGIAFICLFFPLVLSAQQVRRVYITLDVSGSMDGNRYNLGNYTAQMIYSLCDPDDEVTLIIGGKPTALSHGINSLKDIQKPFNSYNIHYYDTQFGDIVGFNRIYTPSVKKQDWLFIIGDGVWDTETHKSYSDDVKIFRNTVESGKLNVCFLQTGDSMNDKSDFLEYVEKMGIVDVNKVDASRASIKKGCDYFARKILGFSEVDLDVKQSGDSNIVINPELPLSEFVIVYQDDVESNNLPSLLSANVDGADLVPILKGVPTTTPLNSSTPLSGIVWKIESTSGIPAGKDIVLSFDKSVKAKNLSVFPLVNIEFSSTGIDASGNSMVQIGSNVFCIGMSEKKATVRIEINSSSFTSFPETLMKKSNVVVHANNKDYKAKYVNGGYEAEIDIIDDETQYYAEIDCPGYFKKRTDIVTLKKGDCAPVVPEPEVRKLDVIDFGHLTFNQLDGAKFSLKIFDDQTKEILDPTKFDLDIPEGGFMYDIKKYIQGEDIILEIHPKGSWCECLFPLDIDLTVRATPKRNAVFEDGKNYNNIMEAPVHFVVDKNRSWFPRCLWLIVTVASLFSLLIYLRSMIKKRRFKKNARISSVYYNYYGSRIEGGVRYLRAEGFGAWLKRWFSPMDERIDLSWSKPRVNSFTVVASDSREMVDIRKSYLTSGTMSLSGYDPDSESENDKSKYVHWADGENIEVSLSSGGKDGELTFVSGEEDDGALYRILLSLLSVVDILLIVALLLMMFRAL